MNNFSNRVQLIGRVGKDPEVLNLEDGKKLAKFSMATTEFYRDKKGDRMELTSWHLVSFWNKTANIIERYVTKGSQIAVEGKLTTRSWEDMSGTRHYQTQIVGYNLILLGKKEAAME